MRPVDNKNAAPHPIYDTTFDNSTGTLLLQIQELTYNLTTGTNASYNFFRNGLNFNGAVPIAVGNIGVHQAGGIQTVGGVNVRPNMAPVAVLTPNTVIYRQTYQAPARNILIPNRNNGGNVVINARIQAIEYHTAAQRNRLFVTLYAKSTYKMPRQHTSNPKIPKVSKAIASPFY